MVVFGVIFKIYFGALRNNIGPHFFKGPFHGTLWKTGPERTRDDTNKTSIKEASLNTGAGPYETPAITLFTLLLTLKIVE